MKITVFGAAGGVGSRVMAEARSRGHTVTGLTRDAARSPGLRQGDAADVEDVITHTAGQDLVISATRPAPGREADLVVTTKAVLAGLDETGVRTGRCRLGRDELIVDGEGNSTISMEDLAVALLDEAERPRHHRTRFTVGY